MHALTYHGVESLAYETVPDPQPAAAGDAVVAVTLAGVCGSDLHVYHGRESGLDRGTVMGHELVGRVLEVGPGVERFRAGDRVVSPFTTSCGGCFYCRRGLTCRCRRGELFGWVEGGRGLHGAQAEAVRVPLADSTLVAVPDGLGDEAALLVGDVLATGFYGAELAGAGPGAVTAVVGCGPVGLMAVIAAGELGAERVFAVDPVAERRALAERLGADAVTPEAAVAALRGVTGGRGADAVVEAVGSAAATRLAVELARPGAALGAVGVHHEPALAFSPGEAYDKNLTYRAGRCPVRALIDRLLPLAERRRDDLAAVISHRLPLADGARAYQLFASRSEGCTKAVLIPRG